MLVQSNKIKASLRLQYHAVEEHWIAVQKIRKNNNICLQFSSSKAKAAPSAQLVEYPFICLYNPKIRPTFIKEIWPIFNE